MKYQRNWEEISKRLEDEAMGSGGGMSADKRMYRPKFSKDGTFDAVIRFLPALGDEVPLVKKFAHRFKYKGGEYNEECLTTIGLPCPVCQANTELWAMDTEAMKDIAKKRARNKSGISNILVISDPQVPANNGKVFIYRYGKVILDKVIDKCFPDEKKKTLGVKPVNVFDYYEGANFRISAKKVATGNVTWPKYDNSTFDSPSVIGDDQFIESIEKQLYSLKEFVQPDKFKSYDALSISFNKVRGEGFASTSQSPVQNQVVLQNPIQLPVQAPAIAPVSPVPEAPAPIPNAAPSVPANAMDFNAIEDQSEDDFCANVMK
jgi:hypothetical protein